MKLKRNILIGAAVAGAGGAVGSALRALCLLGNAESIMIIFWVNVLGSFLFGFFMRMLQRRYRLNHHFTEFLLTGLCGGLTTFSSVMTYFDVNNPGEFLACFFMMSLISMFALTLGSDLATKIVKIG